MNKEKIEEAKKFATNNPIGWPKTVLELSKLMAEFLESKREEIERKAYEAGHKNTFCSEYTGWSFELTLTYDQWKESQKQE